MKYLILFILLIITQLSAQKTNNIYEWSIKYQPVNNIIIGIWPPWSVWYDSLKLRELKSKYGFNHIVVYDDIRVFTSVRKIYGSDMMLAFQEGWYNTSDTFKGLWSYYLDEPIRGNIDSIYIKKISSWIHKQNAGSLFLSGDYKRTDYLKQISDNYTDGILYTSYSNWDKFLAWWIPGSEDQRESWRDMKRFLDDKFYMTWVNAYSDTSSYQLLFREAKFLKLTGIWLYNHESDISTRTLDLFCEALVKQGYMKKVYGWITKKMLNGKIVDIDYDSK